VVMDSKIAVFPNRRMGARGPDTPAATKLREGLSRKWEAQFPPATPRG
jgi:hypothetical protein